MKSDLETEPITSCKQQLSKELFNICLLIEVNHITSQPSLPKKIKSCPWSVLSRWVLGICLQSVFPIKAEILSPLQDCHHRVSGFLLLPVFGSSCLRNRSDCVYSQLQDEIYLPFSSPPPHPKQTNTLPASYSALEEGLFFLF